MSIEFQNLLLKKNLVDTFQIKFDYFYVPAFILIYSQDIWLRLAC